MKFKFILIFIFIFSIKINANNGTIFLAMLREQNLNYETKSRKGWLRILNNREKLIQYNLHVYSQETIDKAILEIKLADKTELRGDL